MVADSFAVRYLAGESLHEVLEGPFREAVKVTPAMCWRFMESCRGCGTSPREVCDSQQLWKGKASKQRVYLSSLVQ